MADDFFRSGDPVLPFSVFPDILLFLPAHLPSYLIRSACAQCIMNIKSRRWPIGRAKKRHVAQALRGSSAADPRTGSVASRQHRFIPCAAYFGVDTHTGSPSTRCALLRPLSHAPLTHSPQPVRAVSGDTWWRRRELLDRPDRGAYIVHRPRAATYTLHTERRTHTDTHTDRLSRRPLAAVPQAGWISCTESPHLAYHGPTPRGVA